MQDKLHQRIQAALDKRKLDGSFRELRHVDGATDFSSNDYLGFARDPKLRDMVFSSASSHTRLGATGSRLLSGHYPLIQQLEKQAASFHAAPAALFFPSGYHANAGLLSTVIRSGDLVFHDKLIHASLHEGLKLSGAQSQHFEHNSLERLEDLLRNCPDDFDGAVFVVVESVYSMDGDQADLNGLAALQERYGFKLIVDEAHATGLFGPDGGGCVQEAGIAEACFARVHTYGKAMGGNGGMVLGSTLLRTYLLNFCKAFIYTTAPPAWQVVAVIEAYNLLPQVADRRRHIEKLGGQLEDGLVSLGFDFRRNRGAIQSLVLPGNAMVLSVSESLLQAGFDVRPIRYPTVPKGEERLRINLHAFNTEAEVAGLIACLKTAIAAKNTL